MAYLRRQTNTSWCCQVRQFSVTLLGCFLYFWHVFAWIVLWCLATLVATGCSVNSTNCHVQQGQTGSPFSQNRRRFREQHCTQQYYKKKINVCLSPKISIDVASVTYVTVCSGPWLKWTVCHFLRWIQKQNLNLGEIMGVFVPLFKQPNPGLTNKVDTF